jgi:DNA-directed RNA polymerase specialized sigma54-like protein
LQYAQEFRLTQQAVLAPRLQQSVRLLQMSTIEFTDAVQQVLNSNPFLGDADDKGEESPSTQAAQGSPETRSIVQESITVSAVSLQEQLATLDCPYRDEGESDIFRKLSRSVKWQRGAPERIRLGKRLVLFTSTLVQGIRKLGTKR